MLVGIYHHPSPPDLTFIHSVEVAPTWTNEAAAFISAYAAKSLLFLRRLPIPPP